MEVFLLLLLSLSSATVFADQVWDEGKLIFVQVVFRHGDRTPIDPYPNDPYRDPSNWPTGFGQLTNLGKMQHYELGMWLRERYHELINDTYSRDQVYVRSTDVDRTLMSAYSNLAGLYPPTTRDLWNPDVHWQPIPVHTEREKHDKILSMKKACPAYDADLSSLKKSDEYVAFNAKYKEAYDYMTKNSGRSIHGLEAAQYLYSNLLIEDLHNMTLPEWTAKVYPEPLKSLSARAFAIPTFKPSLARLKAGPLLQDILERLQSKANGSLSHDRVMVIYSGHDTTVAALLNILRVFEWHNPPFRACVMLELRTFLGVPYVSVVYKNETTARVLPIPNCGVTCPLERMFQLYADVLPDDWDSECRGTPMVGALIAKIGYDFGSTLIIISVSAALMLLSLVIFAVLRHLKYRNTYSEIIG